MKSWQLPETVTAGSPFLLTSVSSNMNQSQKGYSHRLNGVDLQTLFGLHVHN
jgi:hypothetical protein